MNVGSLDVGYQYKVQTLQVAVCGRKGKRKRYNYSFYHANSKVLSEDNTSFLFRKYVEK